MFRWIEGIIIDKGFNHMVINAGGVGYYVFCSPNTVSHFHQNDKATLWLYTSVRENSIDIYGFTNKDELAFFELLLTINGIGPKSAIGIISTSNVEVIKEGVISGDAAYLSKTTGIGKKTAEKILIGLKDKLGAIDLTQSQSDGSVAIDALAALGYSERDARTAVQKVKTKTNTEDIIKEALQILSGKK